MSKVNFTRRARLPNFNSRAASIHERAIWRRSLCSPLFAAKLSVYRCAMKTLLKSRYTLLCSIIAFACLVAAFIVFKSEAAKPPTTGASVRAAGRGRPFLNLRDGYALKGTDASAAAFGAAGNARPLTLAAADFDLDGAPDLLSGYAAGGQGLITFRRGNIDAFAPSDPAIFQAIQQGQMPDSLLPDTRSFS